MNSVTCVPAIQPQTGFTLIELMLVAAILGIVLSLAVPSYQSYVERADIVLAIADINTISMALDRYQIDHDSYPASLEAVGLSMDDPWGNPYRYTNIQTAQGKGSLRKDKNLVPINSDFDLFSMGKDGASAGPLTAKSSKDDIIRANNGGYIGPVAGF